MSLNLKDEYEEPNQKEIHPYLYVAIGFGILFMLMTVAYLVNKKRKKKIGENSFLTGKDALAASTISRDDS